MGFFPSSSLQSKETRQPTIARCGSCGLSKECFSPRMEPTGRGRKRVLFVAEAPGEEEDRQGIQLIGKAGKLCRKLINEIGEELEDCIKTNAVICHPPGNKMQPIYLESCRPNLIKVIQTLQPRVIVAMGSSAVQSLLALEWKKDLGELARWVGWTIPSRTYNCWICPTYHPSFLARLDEDPLLCKMFKDHVKRAFELEGVPITAPSLKELQDQVELVTDPRLARLRLRDLAEREGVLAFDYETTGLKPELSAQRIVSCSFCLDGKETWACPIDERSHKALSQVLRSTALRKVASNMKFEDRWTRAKLGHRVKGWWWDTMLAAHVIDNREKITSIKFQAFVYLGVADYNAHVQPYLESPTANGLNRIMDLDMKDLLVYNGLDSLLEYKVAMIQRGILPCE